MLQIPNDLSPSSETFDGTNAHNFTAVMKGGTCYGYQLYIDQVDSTTYTELQIYDSTKIDITSSPVYDRQTLTVTVPGGTVTNTTAYFYKWRIDLYYDTGLTSFQISPQEVFFAYSTPTLGFVGGTPIVTQTSAVYTFLGDYTQTQDRIVKYWNATLYEADGVTVKKETGRQITTYLYYQFGGLDNGGSYYIQYEVTTQDDIVVTSSLEEFDVLFVQLIANNTLEATNDSTTGLTDLRWSEFVYEVGTVDNTPTYSTLPGYSNRHTIEPASGDTYFEVDMNNSFTLYTLFYPLNYSTFSGYVVKASNTNGTETAGVLYDAPTGVFSLEINGTVIDTITDLLTTNDIRIVAFSKNLSNYEWTVFI